MGGEQHSLHGSGVPARSVMVQQRADAGHVQVDALQQQHRTNSQAWLRAGAATA
jgi:hypothetical protein